MVKKRANNNRYERRASIKARELLDKQDQTRPSGAYHFYPEVEASIKEEATAVRLESFLVIKTKAIYNSILQWADKSNRGAQSLI